MEEKEVEKREKGKSGFGKSPFCFCLTVSLPLPFFPCTHHTTTPKHMLTLIHHTPYNMTHWCTPSHANRAVCCAAFFFGSGQRDTLHHPHPTLHHLTSRNTPTNPTQTQLMVHATMRCQLSMRRGLDKGQKWDNTAAPTH